MCLTGDCFEALFRCNSNIKSNGIKHDIRRILIQRTVIGKCNQSCYLHIPTIHPNRISHSNTSVICMHAVDYNLVIRCRPCTLHQFYKVTILTGHEHTNRSIAFFRYILIELLIDLYIAGRFHGI